MSDTHTTDDEWTTSEILTDVEPFTAVDHEQQSLIEVVLAGDGEPEQKAIFAGVDDDLGYCKLAIYEGGATSEKDVEVEGQTDESGRVLRIVCASEESHASSVVTTLDMGTYARIE